MINLNSPQHQFLNAVNQYIDTNPNANLEVGELDGESNPGMEPQKCFSHTLARLTSKVVLYEEQYQQLAASFKPYWHPIHNLVPGSSTVFYEQNIARQQVIQANEVSDHNLIKDAKLLLELAAQIPE